MTMYSGMTFTIQCDRCGARLVLASGLNAHSLAQSQEAAANCAAKSGWSLELDDSCECADCAAELHGKDHGGGQ